MDPRGEMPTHKLIDIKPKWPNSWRKGIINNPEKQLQNKKQEKNWELAQIIWNQSYRKLGGEGSTMLVNNIRIVISWNCDLECPGSFSKGFINQIKEDPRGQTGGGSMWKAEKVENWTTINRETAEGEMCQI